MDLQQDLKDFIAERGITQAALARAVGVSSAAISQYLKGEYAGDVASLEHKLQAWLLRQTDRQNERKLTWGYVQTETARRIGNLLKMAHINGEAVVLYGQAGLGKTSALLHYHKHNPDAIFIETDPSFTAKVLLQNIAQTIGSPASGSLHEVMQGIVDKLKNSSRLLMIDEAELLPLRALECLRRIHDKTGCGLVLAGMPRLLINLKGKRGELVQLYSRIGFAMNLGDALSATDLRQIVQTVLSHLPDDATGEMVAAVKGNTRVLCKLMRGVHNMEQINQETANKDMVRQYAQMLIHRH